MDTANEFRTPFRPEGFDFAGQAALRGVRCVECGERYFPPRSACLNCAGTHLEPIAVSARGKIYSFTVIHRAPTGFPAPYGCGWVLTEDGIKLWAMFKGAIERLRVGLPMEMVFGRLGERTIYYFQPADSARGGNA